MRGEGGDRGGSWLEAIVADQQSVHEIEVVAERSSNRGGFKRVLADACTTLWSSPRRYTQKRVVTTISSKMHQRLPHHFEQPSVDVSEGLPQHVLLRDTTALINQNKTMSFGSSSSSSRAES